jgi:hypothetical protein
VIVIIPALKRGIVRLSSIGMGNSSTSVAEKAPAMATGRTKTGLILLITNPIKRQDTRQEKLPSKLLSNILCRPNFSPITVAIKSPIDRKRTEVIATYLSNKTKTAKEERRR